VMEPLDTRSLKKRWPQIFEEFGLVEAEMPGVKNRCVAGRAPSRSLGALIEVRRSWDAGCPACRRYIKVAGDVLFFFEHGEGLEDNHLRGMRVSCISRLHICFTVWDFRYELRLDHCSQLKYNR
jgi:hypothetical protein